jgi:peptidoglycan/LPS O-acetylase OafA/YrhL
MTEPTEPPGRRALRGAAPTTDRFPCIDGLRAIAALAVVAFHYLFVGGPEPLWLRGRLQAVAWAFGGQGVAIFFVISGFLLYRPFAIAHFADQAEPPSVPFWTRRAVRIFPAYWVALSFALLTLGIGTIRGFGRFFALYTLTQGYHRGLELAGLGVAWTLVIEVSFYATLPFIALGLRALGGADTSRTQRLRRELLALALLFCVGAGARGWWLWSANPPKFVLQYTMIWYLDVFALGLLLAIASAWCTATGRIPRLLDAVGRVPWLWWTTALVVYVWSCPLAGGRPGHPPVSRLVALTLPMLRGAIAVLLITPAVLGDQHRGAIRALLRSRPATYLGTISFGIYLWHLTMIRLIARWISHGSLTPDPWVRLITTAALTATAATASFYLVERPAIARGRRWSARAERSRALV